MLWEDMVDFNGKVAAAISAGIAFVLMIFSYITEIIPSEYENYKPGILILGILISLILVRSEIAKAWPNVVSSKVIYCPLKKHCINEKYFRFLSINKSAFVFPDGTELNYIVCELVNEGKNSMRRFPYRLGSTFTSMDPLDELVTKENFEIKSLDGHSLHLETVEDEPHRKLICIVFDEDIRPGEKRTYSIRFQMANSYKIRREELPNGECEYISFTMMHICNRYKTRLAFHPNYKYSNPRYCVRSPSHEVINELCRELPPQADMQTGGTFFEVEELNPWRNFQYRIEWMPEN